MSGRRLKKRKAKQKRMTRLALLSIELDCIIKMTEQYLKDLKEKEDNFISNTGGTMRFRRFENIK